MAKEPQSRTCEYRGCGETFETTDPRKRFCDSVCAHAEDRERKRDARAAKMPSLDETLAAAAERDKRRQNTAEARKVLAAENRMRRYERILEANLQAYDPTPLVVEPPKDGLPTQEWINVMSDWHVGAKVTLEETGGIYHQNIETVRAQVGKLWTGFQRLHAIEASGRRVTKLHDVFIGDLIDHDDLRPSQHRKVDDVFTVQTVQGFDLLAWTIRQHLTLIPEVEIDLVGGNHDRISRSRGDAGLGELDYVDTVAWLAGEFLKRVLANDIAEGRLKVRNWETFFGYKKVADKKLVFEHGSSFKWNANSYGGVPWYSVQSVGPRYEAMLGGADIVLIGHGHRAAILPNGRGWIVVNGALPATSTYVQSGMKVVSRPLQWLLSVHRDMGITDFKPLYADPDDALLPGMVWENPEFYADLASGATGRGG